MEAGADREVTRFQASTTTMFSRIVIGKEDCRTSVEIPGLDPGDYFWRVRAIDEKNNVSDASDTKVTLVAQGKEQEMLLEVDDTELQGNVVEVIGAPTRRGFDHQW